MEPFRITTPSWQEMKPRQHYVGYRAGKFDLRICGVFSEITAPYNSVAPAWDIDLCQLLFAKYPSEFLEHTQVFRLADRIGQILAKM